MTTVTDNAGLMSALGSATGGETILCEPGNYGDVTLSSKEYTSPVTVRSSDQGNMAVIESFDLTGVTNLHFAYIDFDRPDGDGSSNDLDNSHNCQIRFCTFQGGNDLTTGFPIGTAVQFKNAASHIRIEGCSISNWHYAFFAGEAPSDIAIVNNDISGITEDFFHTTGVVNLLYEGNLSHTVIDDGSGAHNDHFQMWQPGGSIGSHNITLRGNIFLIGATGDNSQTIFCTGAASNVLIEHNVIFNASTTAIRTAGQMLVRNNTVLLDMNYLPNSLDMTISSGTNVVKTDNLVPNTWNASTAYPDDLVIIYDDDQHARYVENLLVNAHLLTSDPTLADLMGEAGSQIFTEGFGADMTRTGVRHVWQPKMNMALQLRAS